MASMASMAARVLTATVGADDNGLAPPALIPIILATMLDFTHLCKVLEELLANVTRVGKRKAPKPGPLNCHLTS